MVMGGWGMEDRGHGEKWLWPLTWEGGLCRERINRVTHASKSKLVT